MISKWPNTDYYLILVLDITINCDNRALTSDSVVMTTETVFPTPDKYFLNLKLEDAQLITPTIKDACERTITPTYRVR